MSQVLGEFFDQICMKYKDNECIYFPHDGRRYTYKDFHEYCIEFAKSLIGLGLKKGDHIAIKSGNTPEWIALQMASSKIGVVLVCLNAGLTVQELTYQMQHSEVKFLFTDVDMKVGETFVFPEDLERFIALGEDISEVQVIEMQAATCITDGINIQYTSGTTSNPKAIVSTHKNIVENVVEFNKRLSYTEADKLLLCLPLAHVMGCILSIFPIMCYGASMIIVKRFKTVNVLRLVQQERCTALNAVPTMFMYLLKECKNYDTSSLRIGMMGGSIANPKVVEAVRDELGIKEIYQVYGQTEALAITQSYPGDPMEKRMTTVGRVLDGIEAKVIHIQTGEEVKAGEEGELLLFTPYLMQGYLKNKEATDMIIDQKGWLHTGDLVTMDEEGFITIKARIKEIVIRGGENICPQEIEEEMGRYPYITEVAVIGVPDEYKEEELCAFYVSDVEINIDELKLALSKVLARHKIPKYIYPITSLPKTASGKVKKFELRETYNQYRAAEEGEIVNH